MTLRCWAARWPISLDEMRSERVDAGERLGERLGLGVVGLARRDAEVGGLGGVAGQRDDFSRGALRLEPGDDEAAKLAGGSGDGDGHAVHPVSRLEGPDA